MNFLLILIFIGIGIYVIYNTYKNPAPLISTDLKGYFGGAIFILLGIISLCGEFSIVAVLKEIFK